MCPKECNQKKRHMDKKNYNELLGVLSIFSLKKIRLWRDMIAVFKYLQSCYEESGEELFRVVTKGVEDKKWI